MGPPTKGHLYSDYHYDLEEAEFCHSKYNVDSQHFRRLHCDIHVHVHCVRWEDNALVANCHPSPNRI